MKKPDHQVGFYCLLDTLNARDTRTIINLETKSMPDQFEAQGHSLKDEKHQAMMSDAKYNYGSRIYIKQIDTIKNLRVDIILNVINGNITVGRNKKFIHDKEPREIPELWVRRLRRSDSLSEHIEHKGVSFYRDQCYITDREKLPEEQPLTDGKTPLYAQSRINWDIMCVHAKLWDDITVSTLSRNAKFSFSFPHDHRLCIGALVREDPANIISKLFFYKKNI